MEIRNKLDFIRLVKIADEYVLQLIKLNLIK